MKSAEDTIFPVIGLTGGTGAGKTIAAAVLADLGCARIDADAVGHELLGREEVKYQVRKVWGDRHIRDNGEVDRTSLAGEVFSNFSSRSKLESILHPRMREEISGEIEKARRAGLAAAVIDAAVLFEAGWDDLCTHTVFLESTYEERLHRLKCERGWDEKELARRESCQIPLDKKKERCSHVIVNHSDVSHLSELVGELLNQILNTE